jgi:hypothetical protein
LAILPVGQDFRFRTSTLWLLSKFEFSGTILASAVGETKSDLKIALPRRGIDQQPEEAHETS